MCSQCIWWWAGTNITFFCLSLPILHISAFISKLFKPYFTCILETVTSTPVQVPVPLTQVPVTKKSIPVLLQVFGHRYTCTQVPVPASVQVPASIWIPAGTCKYLQVPVNTFAWAATLSVITGVTHEYKPSYKLVLDCLSTYLHDSV